jgi:hypothetical protein
MRCRSMQSATIPTPLRAAFSSANAFEASAAEYFFDAACAGATAMSGGTATGALNACSCNARRRETSTSTQLAHSRVIDAAVALSARIIFSLLNSTARRPQPLQRMLSAGRESIQCSVCAAWWSSTRPRYSIAGCQVALVRTRHAAAAQMNTSLRRLASLFLARALQTSMSNASCS